MTKRSWIALSLACVVGVGLVVAQAPDGGQQRFGPGDLLARFPLMAAIDADQNGEISTKEMKKAAAALRSLDADEDGTLTQQELMPQVPNLGGGPPGGGRIRSRGGPQNGGPPGPEAFVDRAMQFDADKDGKLDRSELTEMARQFARRPPGPPPGETPPQRQPDDQPPDRNE